MPVMDWKKIRERLKAERGPTLWRSLDDLAQTPEFTEMLGNEFPQAASAMPDGPSRRQFLQVMAASFALAGLTSCTRQPEEEIVPYVKQPEQMVTGKPLFYATTLTLGGYGRGVLVESHEGRPTKIEGNPDHPASLGATDIWMQAAILGLYDPDRSQAVTHLGEISTWKAFVAVVGVRMAEHKKDGGKGLAILTGPITSPSLISRIYKLLEELPEARWYVHDPLQVGASSKIYRFDKADVVVSLDRDFLHGEPGSVRYARDFMSRRRATLANAESRGMSRLYVAEPMPSVTGTTADHRMAMKSSDILSLAIAIADKLGLQTGAKPNAPVPDAWVEAVAKDLSSHRGRGIVLAGRGQPPFVHQLIDALNGFLENNDETVLDAPFRLPSGTHELAELGSDTQTLVVLGANPVYDAPGSLGFADRFAKIPFRVHLGLYRDETSELCHWHVPAAHELESWGDACSFDGTAGLVQPLIAPLFGGRSAHELLAALTGRTDRVAYDLVRDYWKGVLGEDGFDTRWRRALHDGVVPNFAAADLIKAPTHEARPLKIMKDRAETRTAPMELCLRPDPSIYDGSFANNGWLQELPKPITSLTWDNALFVSPATAKRLNLQNEQLVRLSRTDKAVAEAPVWITPGHADECFTLHLGYGRTRAGRVGTGAGANAYPLQDADDPWTTFVTIEPLSKSQPLSPTQRHHNLEGRDIVRSTTLADFIKHPRVGPMFEHHAPPESDPRAIPLSLYSPPQSPPEIPAWGMVIDMTSCTGCNACVVACQAENNIPVVGREQVAVGREMQWIRIDHYYEGTPEDPLIHNQPMLCQHCEAAPCEVVCPVGATQHSDEGLNEMVYNRCIGTRYCSNNCPYKVRRFNFLQYADKDSPSLGLMWNPDVTVRSRGVMEKCTYCVQRISRARIEAKKEDRAIRDGEIITACQGACPTQAITFGNIRDPKSKVAALRDQPHNYSVLGELNTLPRTTYLARVRNVNPELDRNDE